MTEGNVVFENAGVSTESLATLGESHIAYVKQIRAGADSPGAEDRAGTEAFRTPCRRRHADHADRQPGSGDRECMEQRAAVRQRSLTELLLLSLTRHLPVSLTQALPVSMARGLAASLPPCDLDDDVVRGLDPRIHRSF